MLHSSIGTFSICTSTLVYSATLRSRSVYWSTNNWILFCNVFLALLRLLLMSRPSNVRVFATLGGWQRRRLGTRIVDLVGGDFCGVSLSRVGSLTSFIVGMGVLRRVCWWWTLGVFWIALGDVASVDVDTVGVAVGAFLLVGVFLMIAVKFWSAFACLSFYFSVCSTAACIAVRWSGAAMRVLSTSEIVGTSQCSRYIFAELDMCIFWVDGTQYFLLQ